MPTGLKNITIIAIILGAVASGLFAWIMPLWSAYGILPDANFTHTFTAVNNSLIPMTSYVNNQSALIESGSSISVSSVTNLVSLSENAVGFLLYPFKIVNLFIGMANDLSTFLGLAPWVTTAIIALLLATISFAIISAIVRWVV